MLDFTYTRVPIIVNIRMLGRWWTFKLALEDEMKRVVDELALSLTADRVAVKRICFLFSAF